MQLTARLEKPCVNSLDVAMMDSTTLSTYLLQLLRAYIDGRGLEESGGIDRWTMASGFSSLLARLRKRGRRSSEFQRIACFEYNR